jgi:hypothetical protein
MSDETAPAKRIKLAVVAGVPTFKYKALLVVPESVEPAAIDSVVFGIVKVVPSNVSALPVASALVDEAYRTPFAVKEVSPVPPFVVASVPARVTAPEVAVEGVKPVVPALKVVTATPDRVLH